MVYGLWSLEQMQKTKGTDKLNVFFVSNDTIKARILEEVPVKPVYPYNWSREDVSRHRYSWFAFCLYGTAFWFWFDKLGYFLYRKNFGVLFKFFRRHFFCNVFFPLSFCLSWWNVIHSLIDFNCTCNTCVTTQNENLCTSHYKPSHWVNLILIYIYVSEAWIGLMNWLTELSYCHKFAKSCYIRNELLFCCLGLRVMQKALQLPF